MIYIFIYDHTFSETLYLINLNNERTVIVSTPNKYAIKCQELTTHCYENEMHEFFASSFKS